MKMSLSERKKNRWHPPALARQRESAKMMPAGWRVKMHPLRKKKKVWCKIKPKPNSISIVGAVAYYKEEE